MTKRNARFWVYSGGPVKITLRPGQRLSHYRGGPADEGWFSESNSWHYPDDEDAVYREWCFDGRDCDGRHSTSGEDRCELSALHAGAEIDGQFYDHPEHWIGLNWPAWDEHKPGLVYDEFAQAAGY